MPSNLACVQRWGKAVKHTYLSTHREIEIFIRDNGGGYRIGSGASGTGTGMKVITRTLQLLNAYNRRPIVMHINNVEMASHETGCEVYFRLPVDYSFELKKQKKPFYGTDI